MPSTSTVVLPLLWRVDGFVLPIVAILLSAIIVFARLAVDAGLWYAIKRQNQSAADAAALAAAFEYAGAIETGQTTNPTAATTSAASSNGFSSSAPNTLTVNSPSARPASAPCKWC